MLAFDASGIGWGMTLIRIMIAVYYNVILSWSLFYAGASFISPLPWSHCLDLENGGGENEVNIRGFKSLRQGKRIRGEKEKQYKRI